MKKSISILLILLNIQLIFSQFTLKRQSDNSLISDGDVITFNEVGYPGGNMYIDIYNDNSSPIFMKAQCTGLTNTDGSNFQFCIEGTCQNSVYVGLYTPTNPFQIAANGKNGNYDGFLNANPGDGVNYPCDYIFRFLQTDASGNVIGTPVSMTYRYQPTLSENSFDKLQNFGIKLYNTIIDNNLELTITKENLELNIFDLTGKQVLAKKILNGSNAISLSFLPKGVYQLIFINKNNQKLATKIIKR